MIGAFFLASSLTFTYCYTIEFEIESWENMARKKKNKEVSIVATKQDSELITDLEVIIDEQVVGEIYQGEDDRHYQVTYMKNQKSTALSIEDAVESIVSDYNLYN